MVLAKVDLWKLHDGLLYNFLYNNDIDSIHILLNLYDIETNMTNIYPKYRCTTKIRKRLKRLLIPRKDRQLVSYNVGMLIHEDIDRLELALYLQGYKNGYYNNRWVNILEDETIKHFKFEEIYDKNFLFHYDTSLVGIKRIKKDLWNEIDVEEKESKYVHDFIISYCDKVIKKKIYNLNSFIDKQLTIDYSLKEPNIQEEESLLSTKELNKIYTAVKKTIIKNVINMYKDASWFGINDRVLNRYL
ncbi:hypothetical protein K8M07_01765 [Schnuerera sp. xch1]|uniref:hypothetical protein n=1 Tax=Schnuerera sp. xch1 TaxID=2874283 RepID=UPI001CBB0432|nr:hypothetical protein [Schnuerera sp. xch1]MBZ2173981.1 hypothetical protein [Schnuerera sp. xch1]